MTDTSNRSICARRIDHVGLSRFETSVTWCCLADGHAGACSGPEPSVIEPNDLGPGAARRRRY